MNKDFNLLAHITLGIALMLLSLFTYLEVRRKNPQHARQLALSTAVVSWVVMLPSAITYLIFYPATKTLIKAGSWPWVHSIVMETKEHWGLFLPLIATLAAVMVYKGQYKESKRWWLFLFILTIAMAVMGRLIKIGALQ